MVEPMLLEAILRFCFGDMARKRQYLVIPSLGYERFRTILEG